MPKWSAALVALVVVSTGCDDRPISASAALPPIGSKIPGFELPLLDGGQVTADLLDGSPALVALWSTHCSQSRRIKTSLDSLAAANPNLNVLIIAADSRESLEAYADSAGMPLRTAVAGAEMQQLFDYSNRAPERDSLRVAFALPSFLVLNGEGVVAARFGGPFMNSVFNATDSIIAAEGA